MGIFGKLFGALKKTKDNFSGKLRMLFSKNKLGDEFYEELEEILISSDVSVAAAEEVVERVKAQAIDEKLKDEEYVTELLRGKEALPAEAGQYYDAVRREYERVREALEELE